MNRNQGLLKSFIVLTVSVSVFNTQETHLVTYNSREHNIIFFKMCLNLIKLFAILSTLTLNIQISKSQFRGVLIQEKNFLKDLIQVYKLKQNPPIIEQIRNKQIKKNLTSIASLTSSEKVRMTTFFEEVLCLSLIHI